jgi:diguanylate cyclase (GGDEF)-like protein
MTCQLLDSTITRTEIQAVAGSDEIERLALMDSVTGLYNVRAFQKKYKYELKRSRRYKRPLALCMIGLDGFNLVHEDHGDVASHSVLRAIADVILETVRDVDITGRYAAAWFVVLFPETNATGASVIAERIKNQIAAVAVNHEWTNFKFTASIGISSYPAQARNGEALMAQTVQALEQAIQRGGNRVCVL